MADSILIVGGNVLGVEMAGEFADALRNQEDFNKKIDIITRSPRLLNMLPPEAG